MLSFLVYEGGRRMSEERVQVLAMLVTGKITIDQANQLLEVLGEEPLSEPERWSSQSRKQDEGWREPVREFQGRTAAQRMPSFTFDQIIELSEHEVNPDFLKALRNAGMAGLRVEQIIELSEHGVEPDYLIKFRDAGIAHLDVEQIIELSEHEVDPVYFIKFREAGLTDLTVEQIIELSDQEVKPSYARALREAGLMDLSVDQVIEASERLIPLMSGHCTARFIDFLARQITRRFRVCMRS